MDGSFIETKIFILIGILVALGSLLLYKSRKGVKEEGGNDQSNRLNYHNLNKRLCALENKFVPVNQNYENINIDHTRLSSLVEDKLKNKLPTYIDQYFNDPKNLIAIELTKLSEKVEIFEHQPTEQDKAEQLYSDLAQERISVDDAAKSSDYRLIGLAMYAENLKKEVIQIKEMFAQGNYLSPEQMGSLNNASSYVDLYVKQREKVINDLKAGLQSLRQELDSTNQQKADIIQSFNLQLANRDKQLSLSQSLLENWFKKERISPLPVDNLGQKEPDQRLVNASRIPAPMEKYADTIYDINNLIEMAMKHASQGVNEALNLPRIQQGLAALSQQSDELRFTWGNQSDAEVALRLSDIIVEEHWKLLEPLFLANATTSRRALLAWRESLDYFATGCLLKTCTTALMEIFRELGFHIIPHELEMFTTVFDPSRHFVARDSDLVKPAHELERIIQRWEMQGCPENAIYDVVIWGYERQGGQAMKSTVFFLNEEKLRAIQSKG